MPSATTNGWPYPLATEPVRDGAVAIQNLAAEAESRLFGFGVQRGAIAGGVADANGALDFIFPVPFLEIPAVVVTVRDAAILAILHGPLQRAAGFTVLFKTLAGAVRPGAIEFSWIAVGKL